MTYAVQLRYTWSIYKNRKRLSVCLCHDLREHLPFIPSDRLRCCDRYIWCQRSMAVTPLNSRPAMLGSPSHRGSVHTVSRYQFTHVRYRTAAAGRTRYSMYAWCQLTQWDVPDCHGPGGVGLWTLTRMSSIDATSQNAKMHLAYSLLILQRTISQFQDETQYWHWVWQ